jgi:hypothetical protein
VGFLRGTTMNVYSGEQRFGAVVPSADRAAG